MGEIADQIIDEMIGDERWSFFPPRRSRFRRPATRVTCYHCGTKDLRWQNVPGGSWRLHTKDGVLHECLDTPAQKRLDLLMED